MSPTETLHGQIERITFHNEESGFCVLRTKVKGHKELITVVGCAASVSTGENVECHGIWINDRTYGLQFKAEQLKLLPPITAAGVEKYLGSGFIRGIGPQFAKTLVKAFGVDVFEVFDKNPEKLTKLPGFGEKRKEMILASWAEQKAVREIMVFLQSHGVGIARSVRIYRIYGDAAIEKIRDNPYCLAIDIPGVGFKTADELALKLGMDKHSPKRARAGVCHVLQEFSNKGHCAALQEKLLKAAIQILEIPEEIILNAINSEIEAKNLVADFIDEQPCLYLTALYKAENLVAKHLTRLHKGQPIWGNIDDKKALDWVEQQTKLKLSTSQRAAVTLALKEKVLIITGGPGVGKTTITNSILKIIRAKNISIALCAPTGRAAKRINETTGLEAKTIHRLLEVSPKDRKFQRNKDNPLIADLVIVDEVSMIDISLMYHLLCAIPDHAALIIVGDVDQLPSVGPGNVLADMINSQTIPVVRLTEIFRQAATSKIIVNAHRINQGQFPLCDIEDNTLSDFYVIPAETPEEIQRKLLEVITNRIPQRFGFHPLRDIQVLTPMNRGGLGARALNNILQEALNPNAEPKISRFGSIFTTGDKVIQMINNYDKEVFNGDIGHISHIDLEESLVRIDFDNKMVAYSYDELDEIALAYATSIHKSQGSEYPVVIIPLATQHYMLLARNLLYTAVTRGKKLVVIIGQPKAIHIAIKNIATEPRVTKLAERMKICYN